MPATPTETTQKLRQHAKKKLQARETCPATAERAVTPEKSFHGDTLRQFYESQVRQIELEMQNEELCQTRDDLELSRNTYIKLYADTYDFIADGYFTFDARGMIRKANLTDAQLLEIDRVLPADKPVTTFIADTDDREIFCDYLETDAKRLETEIQDAREYAENIVETVREPLVVLSSDLKILTANHSFYETFKVTPEETIGNFIYDVGNRQWDIPKLRVLIEDILPLDTVFNGYEVEHDFPGVGHKIILLNARQIFRKNIGSHIILLAMEDITERKLAEEQLQIAHDELERRVRERTEELAISIENLTGEIEERKRAERSLLNETSERLWAVEALREKEQMLIQQSRQAALGEMIGNIAHQWRQPLNTLGLFTQRLGYFYGSPSFNKDFLDSSVAKSMEIIKHMSKTIDDFRDYFKPDKEKGDFNLRETIKYTLSLLDGSFQNPRISIEIVEKDNPDINGYQNEFAQVLLNILINARDAIIEREIGDARVTITICNEDGCAVVTVADNAGGIPEEIIDKVFDPYFTTKGPQQGTGVGLFMSKTIIEKNMGGRLAVRNTDIGAEFRIEVRTGNRI